MTALHLHIATQLAFAVAISLVAYHLASLPAYLPPSTGHRGLKRSLAMSKGGVFSYLEGAVRLVASWLAPLKLDGLRERAEVALRNSGYYLGLSPDEFLAYSLVAGFGFGAIGMAGYAADMVGLPLVLLIFVAAFLFPTIEVQTEISRRVQDMTAGLPSAIDLMALCMGAGLDFVSSMRFVIGAANGQEDVVREEFSRVLQALEVGNTRARAMRELAERVPADSVQEFASAVVQAEEKGNPLADVLEVQARMLRARRSVAAEANAQKAAVLMTLPIAMLLVCCMLLIFAPMVCGGLQF